MNLNTMHDLGIVIVHWNTKDLLRKCLQTVLGSEGNFTYRVVVVDNASTDGTVDMIRQEFPQVDLITSEINGGYPYGNNLGLQALGFCGMGDIRQDAPRYALLLNPDTEVPPDSLYDMMVFMDANPDVGIAGPKLLMPDGNLDLACRRSFPSPIISFYHFSRLAKLFRSSPRFARYNMTYVDIDEQLEVDSVVGAYMQVRREAIEQVGLLDETFFMYGEDLDWAYRIKQAGWKVMYHPKVIVWHIKRAASRKNPKAQFEFYRAMMIFYRKHYRKTTPLWMHSLVTLALMVMGGRKLWGELLLSQSPLTNASLK